MICEAILHFVMCLNHIIKQLDHLIIIIFAEFQRFFGVVGRILGERMARPGLIGIAVGLAGFLTQSLHTFGAAPFRTQGLAG